MCFNSAEFAPSADVAFVLEAGGTISAKNPNEIHMELKSTAEISKEAEEKQTNRQMVMDESISNQGGDSASQSCEIATKNSDEPDPNRQGGDFTLYNFYFKSVGRTTIVVWFTLAVTYVLAYQMPSKFALKVLSQKLNLQCAQLILGCRRLGSYMARNSSGKQPLLYWICRLVYSWTGFGVLCSWVR